MQINERIKRIREYRNMTQKELGIALGSTEKSAAVRVDNTKQVHASQN